MLLRTRLNSLGLRSAILLALLTGLAGCNGGGSDDDPVVVPPTVQRLEVTPASGSIAKGTTQQFMATAVLTDNSTQNVTDTATWSSANATTASVSNTAGSKGRATGNNTGSTSISASFDGKNGSATLTVTPAVVTSIQVTPPNPSAAKGTTLQFTATAIFSDATNQNVTDTAAWASSNAAIASVSNTAGSKGLATGNDLGMASISATQSGVSGATTLTVTPAVLTAVQVTPTNPSRAKGSNQQFTATALFSDTTTQNVTTTAAWSSSANNVATISNAVGSQGLATAVDVGSATITATFMSIAGSTTLTVTPAVIARVDVTPPNPSVPKGTSQAFTATAVFTDNTAQNVTNDAGTTWSSSNTTIAQVSNAAGSKGLAAALNEGAATISAVFSGVTGATTIMVTPASITSIQVTPTNENVPVGFNQQYTATGMLSDGGTRNVTNEVTWISTDDTKATISNAAGSKGLATGVTAGTTTIVAQSGSIQGSTQLTVRAATLTSIEVAPATRDLPLGRSQQYAATGTFSDMTTEDLTTEVTWTSSNGAIATISNAAGSKGLAQSVTIGGPVTITATHAGTMVADTATLTVVAAELVSLDITPNATSIPDGRFVDFVAMGTFSDNSTTDLTTSVTWESSATAVASIENGPNDGRATGLSVGSTTIKATQGTVTDTATLNVTAAVLDSIEVTTLNPSVAKGRTSQFTAMGAFSDGSMMNLTTSVTWASSSPTIATISNAAGSQGRASALNVGTTDITASSGAITSPAVLFTVTSAVLDSIAITPANPNVPKGTNRQLTATGSFSDGTTQDLTTTVTWTSDNAGTASVSNSAGTKGFLTGNNVGSTIIRATDPASMVVGMTNVSVTPAVLTGISVTPANAVLPNGFSLQYTATAQFSDGGTLNVTTDMGTTWSSDNTGVATISNAAGAKGLATSVATGNTFIQATFSGFSSSVLLTVSGETLQAIDVTPKNASVGPNGTVQYTAIGTFSAGTTLAITTQVTWASSNTSAATISNAAGSQGRATAGLLPGTTTISASRNGVTGSTTLTRTL